MKDLKEKIGFVELGQATKNTKGLPWDPERVWDDHGIFPNNCTLVITRIPC